MAMVNWDLIQLKCGVCGADMVPIDGPWGVFYNCAHAMPADKETKPCFNRMNAVAYELILEKVTELLTEQPETNFTGFKWVHRTSYQHHRFRVAKHLPTRFIVEVVNAKKGKSPF